MATETSHFEYDGFAYVEQGLERIKTTSPLLQKKVRDAVWQVLGKVRKNIIADANFKNSKHNSIRAIRRVVYKKIMGGNVNILSKGRGKAKSGSNASGRTQQINSYSGADRGFILRFVNAGTVERYAGEGRNTHMGGDYIQSKRGKPGYRGAISARNFFAPSARGSMQEAAEMLAQMIDDEINAQFNKQ